MQHISETFIGKMCFSFLKVHPREHTFTSIQYNLLSNILLLTEYIKEKHTERLHQNQDLLRQ
jgi:hypothetical protein